MAKVKHIALMKFKADTADEQIEKAFDDLLDLSETVSGVENFVWGMNNSPEGRNQDYGHGYVMTFTDAAARDGFVASSDRARVMETVTPLLESTIVFDFEL
jgi:hypothetical protein